MTSSDSIPFEIVYFGFVCEGHKTVDGSSFIIISESVTIGKLALFFMVSVSGVCIKDFDLLFD